MKFTAFVDERLVSERLSDHRVMTNCSSLERRASLRVNCHCLRDNTPLRLITPAPPRQRCIENTLHRTSSYLAAVRTPHRSGNEEETAAGSSITEPSQLLFRRPDGGRSVHQHTGSCIWRGGGSVGAHDVVHLRAAAPACSTGAGVGRRPQVGVRTVCTLSRRRLLRLHVDRWLRGSKVALC